MQACVIGITSFCLLFQDMAPFTYGAADRIKQFGDHIGVTDRYTGYRNNLTRGTREPFKLGTSWMDKTTKGGRLINNLSRSMGKQPCLFKQFIALRQHVPSTFITLNSRLASSTFQFSEVIILKLWQISTILIFHCKIFWWNYMLLTNFVIFFNKEIHRTYARLSGVWV